MGARKESPVVRAKTVASRRRSEGAPSPTAPRGGGVALRAQGHPGPCTWVQPPLGASQSRCTPEPKVTMRTPRFFPRSLRISSTVRFSSVP